LTRFKDKESQDAFFKILDNLPEEDQEQFVVSCLTEWVMDLTNWWKRPKDEKSPSE